MEELKEKIFSGELQDSKTVAAILAYEVKYCQDRMEKRKTGK